MGKDDEKKNIHGEVGAFLEKKSKNDLKIDISVEKTNKKDNKTNDDKKDNKTNDDKKEKKTKKDNKTNDDKKEKETKKDNETNEDNDDEKEPSKHEKLEAVKKLEHEADMAMRDSKNYIPLESNVYLEMDAYVDMVANGFSYGTLLEGAGGTGKTWRVVNRLQGIDYAYTDSFTTPQAFYIWMYKNRNAEVLVVDDVAGFMNNDKVLAFLKGALWDVNGERVLHYMTTKPMQDEEGNFVPQAFAISARMIIITNKLNRKNPHINAVLTRVNYARVEIDHDELMNIIEQVAKKSHPDLSIKERMEVFDFLKENTSDANADLNIRSLIKCFQHYRYSKEREEPGLWKKLAQISILQKNPHLMVVEQLLNDPKFKTDIEKVAEFKRLTGKSRATFFRYQTQLKLAGDPLNQPA